MKCWPNATRAIRSLARMEPLAVRRARETTSAFAPPATTENYANPPSMLVMEIPAVMVPPAKFWKKGVSGKPLSLSFLTRRNTNMLSLFHPHFSCHCSAGYEGDRCETNINDCLDHKCVNNATCVDQVESYRCDCQSGFTGSLIDCCILRNCSYLWMITSWQEPIATRRFNSVPKNSTRVKTALLASTAAIITAVSAPWVSAVKTAPSITTTASATCAR